MPASSVGSACWTALPSAAQATVRKAGTAGLKKWPRLSGISRYAQLKIVNWSANAALVYRSDARAFGVADYWASPAEALRNGGDCEDFVALKYLALRAAGFPEEDLRVVVLQDLVRGQPHAVLVAQLDGIRYVLDNQLDDLVVRYRTATLPAGLLVQRSGQVGAPGGAATPGTGNGRLKSTA